MKRNTRPFLTFLEATKWTVYRTIKFYCKISTEEIALLGHKNIRWPRSKHPNYPLSERNRLSKFCGFKILSPFILKRSIPYGEAPILKQTRSTVTEFQRQLEKLMKKITERDYETSDIKGKITTVNSFE